MTSNLAPTVRILTRAGSAALLLLLSVSAANAAPQSRRDSSACDVTVKAGRKLARHPKSFGGPLAAVQRGPIRTDLTARLLRHRRTMLGDEIAAIQNDAPAVHLDSDEQPVFGLCPVGVLAGPLEDHPRTRAFSPRSPRGPPAAT